MAQADSEQTNAMERVSIVDRPWLNAVPVAAFAVPTALAAAAWASHDAGRLFLSWLPIADVLTILSVAILFALIGFLTARMALDPISVSRELHDSYRHEHMAAMGLCLLLSAAAFNDTLPAFGRYLWMTGALLQLLFTLVGTWRWIGGQGGAQTVPAGRFLTVAGNMMVPVAGVYYAPDDINWFFFSIGLVMWPVLWAVGVNRLMFQRVGREQAPETVLLASAPPAAAFIAYFHLQGEIDVFARILFFVALFQVFLAAVQLRRLFWGRGGVEKLFLLVPVALIAQASMTLYMAQGQPLYLYLAMIFHAALLALTAGGLIWCTLGSAVDREKR